MSLYNNVYRSGYGISHGFASDIYDDGQMQCPECGSTDWDFLLRDCHGDIIGCEDCVSKLYADELFSGN